MKWIIITIMLVLTMQAVNAREWQEGDVRITGSNMVFDTGDNFINMTILFKNLSSVGKTYSVSESKEEILPNACVSVPNSATANNLLNATLSFDIITLYRGDITDIYNSQSIPIGADYFYIPQFYITMNNTGYFNSISPTSYDTELVSSNGITYHIQFKLSDKVDNNNKISLQIKR